MSETTDKVTTASRDVDRHIFESNVRPWITPETIAEHRASPFGPHSSGLGIVLRYLRRDPIKTKPRYLIVSPTPYEKYCVAQHSRARGAPVRITDQCYTTEEEAEHAVFLLRLQSLEDPYVDRALGEQAFGQKRDATATDQDPHAMGIVGYCDRVSVAPSETVQFFTSCAEGIEKYRADIVRLLHGDPNPKAPKYKEESIQTTVNGEYRGRFQEIHPGSHVIVPDHPALDLTGSFSIQAMIWPTTPRKGRQGIITKWSEHGNAGYGLLIDEQGCVALQLADGAAGELVSSGKALTERSWYFVAGSYDATTGMAVVHQEPISSTANSMNSPLVSRDATRALVERVVAVRPGRSSAPLVIAGWLDRTDGETTVVGGHYNGKIDRPRVAARALSRDEMQALVENPLADGVAAAWDFAEEITSEGVRPFSRISDASPNALRGEAVNTPTRAVTGYNWSGREHHYIAAPSEYGAIHFHDDDLDDAGWTADFELTVPPNLESGVYAARLRSDAEEDYIPFFVRPPRDRATAAVGLLVPTNSYLAYANDNVAVDDETQELVTGRVPVLSKQGLHLNLHREYGGSLYDLHTDGSGTCYSSWLRPILTLRPRYRHSFARVWQFNADLHLTDWLAHKGVAADVFTDQDLHLDGTELLGRYRVIVTGTHPEYYSGDMLDSIEAYLLQGGRFMYLGGNGFYWAVAFHPDKPHLIEVRRWGGTGNWSADPGEYYLSFSGEMGGIWRNRGRPPQKLVGVGFVAQGLDLSTYYRRKPDSFDNRASWIFEGVGDHELIGNFGLMGDGAAGLELDCYDPELGSPPNGYLLASSEAHTGVITEVRENFGGTLPNLGGEENPKVRADLVYFTTPGGGGVFSTGSIAWCASLSHNGYENNVSRLTENVLRRFAADEPLPE